jgi:hypothetical protein
MLRPGYRLNCIHDPGEPREPITSHRYSRGETQRHAVQYDRNMRAQTSDSAQGSGRHIEVVLRYDLDDVDSIEV